MNIFVYDVSSYFCWVEFLGYWVYLCSVLALTVFQSGTNLHYSLQYECPSCSIYLLKFDTIIIFFIFVTLVDVWRYLCGFNLPTTYEAKTLTTCLLTIWIISSVKSFKSFAHLSIELLSFFFLLHYRILYIFWNKPLSNICNADIFSQPVASLLGRRRYFLKLFFSILNFNHIQKWRD